MAYAERICCGCLVINTYAEIYLLLFSFFLCFRRDLISMLSLAGEERVSHRSDLFSAVLDLLTCHLKSIEIDFFEV
jgi:hypothetical protein